MIGEIQAEAAVGMIEVTGIGGVQVTTDKAVGVAIGGQVKVDEIVRIEVKSPWQSPPTEQAL